MNSIPQTEATSNLKLAPMEQKILSVLEGTSGITVFGLSLHVGYGMHKDYASLASSIRRRLTTLQRNGLAVRDRDDEGRVFWTATNPTYNQASA